MLYKAGDEVIVRNDLKEGVTYYMENTIFHNSVVKDMFDLQGSVVTIRHADESGYWVVGSNWGWTDEMFEGLADCHMDADDTFVEQVTSLL